MAIDTVATVVEYSCDGATTTFPITFDYLKDEYVLVKHYDSSLDNLSDLVLVSDYTIVSDEVNMVSTYPTGDKIFIMLSLDFKQDVDLLENGQISSEILDFVHDKLTLLAQENKANKDSSISLEVPDPTVSLKLPVASQREAKYITFDSLGNLAMVTVVDEETITVSTFGETLINTANATAARTVLDTYAKSEVYTQAEIDTEIGNLEADLGGTGRTTETIKGNADNIATNASNLETTKLGFNAITLTNWDSSTTVPGVAAGSKIEANGSVYSFTTSQAISITGASSGTVYVMFDSSTSTFSLTNTAPTWNASKSGFYRGANERYTGHVMTWDGSTSYTDKRMFNDGNPTALATTIAVDGAIVTDGEVNAAGGYTYDNVTIKAKMFTGTLSSNTFSVPLGLNPDDIVGGSFSIRDSGGVYRTYLDSTSYPNQIYIQSGNLKVNFNASSYASASFKVVIYYKV